MTGGFSPYGSPRPPHHPFAKLFPMLGDKELDELGDDIKENGQAESCKLHRGLILDGRNREDAAYRKGLGFRWETFPGDDRAALAFVISKNLRRRHLNESQRAMVAARIATLKLGDNQHKVSSYELPSAQLPIEPNAAPVEPPSSVSQSDAAEMANSSVAGLKRAKIVQEKGAQELQQAVDSGKVTVTVAAELAEELPKEQQQQVAAMSEKEILAKAKEIRDKKNKERRTERIEKLARQAEGNTAISSVKKFPVLYLDPPTKFAAGDSDRSTENHYPTMTEEELAALPIGDLATDDAVIFVWTTVPWLRKTIRLIEGWGFDYVSEFCWDKRVAGLGFWNRNRHESLLIATRGKMPAPAPSELEPSLYPEEKGSHSAKPAYFRDLIARYYPDLPKVELFARGDVPKNWTAWGNEARVTKQQSLLPDEAGEPV